MAKFKVGDIVTGTRNNRYAFTSREATMRVVGADIRGVFIVVEILKYKSGEMPLRKVFTVKEEYFELIKPVQLENK